MANMSYCRFENTARDLWDCCQNMEDNDDLSESERRARRRIIQMCVEIAEDYGYELEEDE